MANLYNISLDELIEFDIEVQEIRQLIDQIKPKTEAKIDWTAAWGKKYPILLQYPNEVKLDQYVNNLTSMINELIHTYNYTSEDAYLVLKDILAKTSQKNA